ncbi:hypothetical protein [Pseudomonas triticicola]|uniref:hypothetical protein n=1 Tax=Pseudomonas triticicola TaxID=2842345 RepID=UPI003EBE318A
MDTKLEATATAEGNAQGTVARNNLIKSTGVRYNVLGGTRITCAFDTHNSNEYISSAIIVFPLDIKNGTYNFTPDGPIEEINYYGVNSDNETYGIKNGKGHVTIEFDRKAGTLDVEIVNIDLRPGKFVAEGVINFTGRATGLVIPS